MTAEQFVGAVLDVLDRLGIDYLLSGSFASNLYGVPRATQDADVVISVAGPELGAIAAALPPELRLDPQASFETITATTRHIITQTGSAFIVELFLLSNDAHDQERFRRRQRITLLDRPVWVPTVEDVVVTKLRWSQHGRRAKDLQDARNVIHVQAARIDWPYVERWCAAHGTRPLLDDLRARP